MVAVMTFRVHRNPDETWREAVIRYASPYGMAVECLEWFDDAIKSGKNEGEAAFDALYEWDVVPLEEDDK